MAKEVWVEDNVENAAVAENAVSADSTEEYADAKAAHAAEMLFPIGEPNDAYAQYFVGQSYLAPVSTSQYGILK